MPRIGRMELCLLGVALTLVTPAFAEVDRTVVRGAQAVGDPVVGVPVDVDLRQLPTLHAWQPGDPIREVPRRDDGSGHPVDTPAQLDPLVEGQRAVTGPTPAVTELLSFDGNVSGANPNDPTGDIGAQYFFEAINGSGGTSVTAYDKATGALAAGPFALDSLSAGGVCNNGFGDPIILYDHIAGRWLLSEFSSSGNGMCIYTSRTADPITGGWCAYTVQDSSFPDYPKFGVWPDLYLGSSQQGNSPPVYALDRVNMLSPDGVSCPTARPFQKLTGSGLPGLGFEAYTPVDLDGPEPPANAPAYFVRHRDEELNGDPNPSPTTDKIELWEFDVDFDNSGNTTFTQLPDIVVAEFDSNLCPPISVFSCIPQPGTSTRLDPLLEVVMNRASYRNFGTHETMLGVLQVDVGDFTDHSGERWFELRRTGGGPWMLFQEGTFSPDAEHRFMGMIAMDAMGDILLGYNVSSSTVFPSIRYTGRLVGDSPGLMTVVESEVSTGGASNSSSRYGDYNQMGIDPIDDCTFWFLGMYNPSGKAIGINSVKFDACLDGSVIFSDGFESGSTSAWLP
ncbi:MAG: hypothetical protein K8J08_12690 [Thermoanaerobaculia bacterium]|nr:hypothetical protein [Thermoanaerobaculia bacterium]